MITRRLFTASSAAGLAAAAFGVAARAAPRTFEVTRTEAEWKKQLTPQQFAVLRHEATEPPFTSVLLKEKRKGVFACAGCERDLFSSTTKYESHTGWPSFWTPIDRGAVITIRDNSLGMERTAVACSRCGGHLGHVFNDGPRPTGLRYCMNGVAMTFRPTAA